MNARMKVFGALLLFGTAAFPLQGNTEAVSVASAPDSVDAQVSDNAAQASVATPKRDLQAAVAALRQTPQPEPEVSPWPLAKGLGLCLAVFCGIVFFLKKLNPHTSQGGKRRMQILERLPVSPKSALLLVQVDGRTRLIAVGSENVQALDSRDRTRPPARSEFDAMLGDEHPQAAEASVVPFSKGVA